MIGVTRRPFRRLGPDCTAPLDSGFRRNDGVLERRGVKGGAIGGYGGLMGAFTESFSADTYMRYKIKQERDGATDNDNPPRGL